jgi:hypothetical protein
MKKTILALLFVSATALLSGCGFNNAGGCCGNAAPAVYSGCCTAPAPVTTCCSYNYSGCCGTDGYYGSWW